MTDSQKQKQLGFVIAEYLSSLATSTKFDVSDVEALQVAVQCIESVFGVNHSDPQHQALYSIRPATLGQLLDVWTATRKRSTSSSGASENANAERSEKPSTPPEPTIPQKTDDSEADKKVRAEEFKSEGNIKMKDKAWNEAVDLYTKAIELDSNNAVYYANRAAAYSQLGQHSQSVSDSQTALAIDPTYSKAYSRMGHAHFCLGQFKESVEAYEKGLELDPTNATMKSGLESARAKLAELRDEKSEEEEEIRPRATETADAGSSNAAPQMPNLAGLGGLGGLAGLMNNPGFMNMAQQMMSNPQFMQAAQSLMGGGGAGGLNPDMLSSMLGGLGGAGAGNPGERRGRGSQ